MTTANSDTKTLVKILIGAAWLDGKIQPEEREYLHRIAQAKGVAEEADIQPLLFELKPVPPTDCYNWVKEYLGDHPTSEACRQLLEEISGLIYSDGTVATEEAALLKELEMLDPASENREQANNSLMQAVRRLYQQGLSRLK